MESLDKNLIEDNNDEDFNFLSEEELLVLSDDERSDYYRKLEGKAEVDQIEHDIKAPEINKENLEEKPKINKNDKFDSSENPGHELYGRFNKFRK